jgi:NAD(P)-dependent dehydrogenase (short-subunit alcohol dehydrogenase family)
MGLKDKNVVVTGGSRGLGLGLVEALVARGARVTGHCHIWQEEAPSAAPCRLARSLNLLNPGLTVRQVVSSKNG